MKRGFSHDLPSLSAPLVPHIILCHTWSSLSRLPVQQRRMAEQLPTSGGTGIGAGQRHPRLSSRNGFLRADASPPSVGVAQQVPLPNTPRLLSAFRHRSDPLQAPQRRTRRTRSPIESIFLGFRLSIQTLNKHRQVVEDSPLLLPINSIEYRSSFLAASEIILTVT